MKKTEANEKIKGKKIKLKEEKSQLDQTNKNLYKELKAKNLFQTSEVIVLTVITCVLGITIGCILGYNLKKTEKISYSEDLEEFIKNYNYIVENNIADVSGTDLIKGAIEGMLSTFEDDYSYVIDENEQENFNIKLDGEYEGVGVEIVTTTDNKVYIYSVFESSPADKAGLKVGDEILTVDGKEMADSTEIANYIKQSEKASFDMKVLRGEEEIEVTLTREKVTINSVSSKMIEKNNQKIGYIYMSIFSASSYRQFKEKLESLEQEGMDSLIIDVRYNNGGHLTTATSILALFLDSNNIIYQTDKDGKIEKFYSSGKETKQYPIVVLQNESSASASEMLAAALKEQYGAIIVGKNSFGKGTVQELITLSDGTEYKFTTKKWLTPKGNWINQVGVSVDHEVDLTDAYFENPIDENDTQLQKALEVLTEGK